MADDKQESLFRKVAIEKTLMPQHPNSLVQVTTPLGWAALLAIFALLVAVVFWSVYGRLPIKVKATGILVRTGAVFNIDSRFPGRVSDVSVRSGDLVQAGQTVARIAQPVLLEQLNQAKTKLDQLSSQHGSITQFSQERRNGFG